MSNVVFYTYDISDKYILIIVQTKHYTLHLHLTFHLNIINACVFIFYQDDMYFFNYVVLMYKYMYNIYLIK